MWFLHVCTHTWLGPHYCDHITLPTHVCAQTRLCPHIFVPRHDWAQIRLCPDTLVPQHELWPDTIMSLDNNKYYNCVHKIMCQLDWWKHKNAQLLLVKRSEKWLFHYCSAFTSSIPTVIFRYFIVSGHKHVWAQSCGHKRVVSTACRTFQTCVCWWSCL